MPPSLPVHQAHSQVDHYLFLIQPLVWKSLLQVSSRRRRGPECGAQPYPLCCEAVLRCEGTASLCLLVWKMGEVKSLADAQVWLLYSCSRYICHASFIQYWHPGVWIQVNILTFRSTGKSDVTFIFTVLCIQPAVAKPLAEDLVYLRPYMESPVSPIRLQVPTLLGLRQLACKQNLASTPYHHQTKLAQA